MPSKMPARGLLPRLVAALLALDFAAAYAPLADDVLAAIPSAADDFDVENGALLAPILIPRIPGTDNSIFTQNHFLSFFESNLPAWTPHIHNSTSKTPATGDADVPFANLIFRRDPPWAAEGDVNRLTLVAHFDTLREPEGFVGAIDSAAPCAALMHVARSVDGALTKKWKAMEESGEGGTGLEEEKGVQILLLDGEEAFVSWTHNDSLYGSRCVAIGGKTPNIRLSANVTPAEPWPRTGRTSSTPPRPPSRQPSSPSPSSSSSTSWAPSSSRASPPTS